MITSQHCENCASNNNSQHSAKVQGANDTYVVYNGGRETPDYITPKTSRKTYFTLTDYHHSWSTFPGSRFRSFSLSTPIFNLISILVLRNLTLGINLLWFYLTYSFAKGRLQNLQVALCMFSAISRHHVRLLFCTCIIRVEISTLLSTTIVHLTSTLKSISTSSGSI